MRLSSISGSIGVIQSLRTSLPFGFASSPPGGATRERRLGSTVALIVAVSVLGAWIALRTLPWFGPFVADSLRAVLGVRVVAALEETAAGAEDRVRLLVSNGRARGLSEATPPELAVQPVAVAGPALAPALVAERPQFRPGNVAAMHSAVASPEDGSWSRVPLRVATEGPAIYRTILHPDPRRAYAELFVFAVDLRQVALHASAGTVEPASKGTGATGTVRPEHEAALIAAFNGGFKAEHGHYGMQVDGRQLLPPKATSCTLAQTSDGSLRIGTWSALAGQASDFAWWRQTPPCMVEDGSLHAGLRTDGSTSWGATIDGDTVIRRSAVGLSPDGSILYVGISNSTTARALASGMQHAGARSVAQLDVNFSYPKFVLYREESAGNLKALSAVNGFLFHEDDYVRRASTRDFFYLTVR